MMGRITGMVSGVAIAAMLAGCASGYGGDRAIAPTPATSVAITQPPVRDQSELQVLFWNDAQRSERFRVMEQWFAGHEVPAAKTTRALPKGAPLSAELQADLKALMASTNAAGIMVLEDGKVRYEAYGLGLGANDRWTSFSGSRSSICVRRWTNWSAASWLRPSRRRS